MTDMPVDPAMWAPAPRDPASLDRIARPNLTYWQDARARLWRNRPAMAAFGFLILLCLAAVFGPSVYSHNYYEQNLQYANVPPAFPTYAVPQGDGSSQEIYFNFGSQKLYLIGADGALGDLVRSSRKDLMRKTQLYTVGDQQVAVDTAKSTLGLSDGKPLEPAGWRWNSLYPLGTDQLGRDELARQLYGARISLAVALVATLVNFTIGVLYGGISGYLGGRVDMVMMRLIEIVSTIPLTLYVILIMVTLASGFSAVILAIGTVYWVDMARIVRGQMLVLKEQDYVAAARSMGASTWRILTRHLLQNTVGPILVTLTMLIPSAIFIESFMSFIGLGVSPPEASWGTLTSAAVETLRTHPYQLALPAGAISLTMFAFNFLGDGLRDALDPRLRS
ncbi:ABC transporter permease [Oryzibacter oryziterrae]|uniref:ABC transporter permease n=1 Tax=Oryzibacter oryziterrae TaxID=2766474 RepID=UPI001F40DED3|nr:ABC transporter permease [Oryzibacter oryziterrae]